MGTKTRRPDHGSFAIENPQEGVMLLHLQEQAAKNARLPGQAWARVGASRSKDRKTEQGFKIYHLDTRAERLTITEEWDGVETARLTVDQRDPPSTPVVPAGPTPPPDPGPTEATYVRLPFHSADLLPDDELRDWLMERAETDVAELSILPRRIRLFGERFQEVVSMPLPFAANLAPGTGATLHALTRPSVERRFVEGWFSSVDARGTAWILEIGEDEAWWMAMRTFERRPGWLGIWTSAWSQRSGQGAATLPTALRPALVVPAGETALTLGPAKGPSMPDIGMFGGALGPEEEVPATAQAVADRVGRDWEAKVPLGGLPTGARFTVFRGREWETWELDGEFPMGLDDLLRAICARGTEPTSVALARMAVVPMEGEVYRALLTSGEAAGRRWTRAFLIRLAPDGSITDHRLAVQDQGLVSDDGWIGVAPITDLGLFTIGAAEA